MTVTQKHWTRLGLSAALVGTALGAGCSPATPADTAEAPAPEQAAAPDYASLPGEAGEGEGGYGEAGGEGEGEGGEGEGGVNVSAAGTDPVVFRSALAITAAHVIAARDAYGEGETAAAAEMFAHPVHEVLLDMEPHLRAQGVADFNQGLLDASTAALDAAPADDVTTRSEDILTALLAAGEKAPDSTMSEPRVAAGVVADQIERAVDMYRGAIASERYEPYLDGYGFYKAAEWLFERSEAEIEGESADTAEAIRSALATLADAYPGAAPQDALDADVSALAVANSNVQLALN